MWLRLLLAFTLIPLAELWLLLRIGAALGGVPTLGLVLITGIVGASLARREGARAWLSVQTELAAGKLPGRELLEAMLVLVAGIVLVTPGILTDLAGLALLVQPIRGGLVRRLEQRYGNRLEAQVDSGTPQGPRIIEI
jgi:UPF0716 protein FxsA